MSTNTNLADNRLDAVVQLRGLLRERFPEAHRHGPASSPPVAMLPDPAEPENAMLPEHPLGVGLLDQLDDGRGIPPGTCVEIVGRRPGSGGACLIAGLIQAATTGENPHPLALIDGADSFDPCAMSDAPDASAALCRRLLWVRCRHRIDHAFKVADLLLRDGNLPVVMLDLQLCRIGEVRRGIPGGNSAWYRLRSLAENTGSVFLAFTTEPIIPATPWRIELDQIWPIDAIDRLPVTGDLRREPIRHEITRRRSTDLEKAPAFAAAS
ncbi:MAG: hypothetical protein KDN19_07565 [Verrucomicrobiae bacterium]|nr:hypothetical protein [Verrucomicrobiae bacterium]